jgi:hypothetical protein
MPIPTKRGIMEELDVAYAQAKELAVCLWRKHYQEDAPNWEPLDTLSGVLSQIDNMSTGLQRASGWIEVSDETPEYLGWCLCYFGLAPPCVLFRQNGEWYLRGSGTPIEKSDRPSHYQLPLENP